MGKRLVVPASHRSRLGFRFVNAPEGTPSIEEDAVRGTKKWGDFVSRRQDAILVKQVEEAFFCFFSSLTLTLLSPTQTLHT